MNQSGYLLDTNIIIALFAGDPKVLERLADKEVLLPHIVLDELAFGAYRTQKVDENLAKIKAFSASLPILNTSRETEEQYAQIRSQLQKAARMIPDNDIWIAAYALEYDLTLVTRDERFQAVDGLKKERW